MASGITSKGRPRIMASGSQRERSGRAFTDAELRAGAHGLVDARGLGS
jgi:hypothetical protein